MSVLRYAQNVSRARRVPAPPWALISTATSSVGSLMLSLGELRTGTTVSFAYFGIVFTYYTLVLNLNRAITGSPTILIYSGDDETTQKRAASFATLTSFALGIGTAVVAAIGFVAFAHHEREVLLVGVAFLPGLLAQDTIRYAYFTMREPKGAAITDLLWTVPQGLVFLVLFRVGLASPVSLLVAWGVAGTAAAFVMARAVLMRSSVRGAWATLVKQRTVIAPLAVEMAALGSGDFLIAIMIAAVGSATILGNYRAGALLVAPFNVFLAAVMVSVVPAGIVRRRAGGRLEPVLVRSAFAVVSFATLIGIVGDLLPARVGMTIFGAQWTSVHALLPEWLFTMTAMGLSTIAFAGLRIITRLHTAMVIRAVSLPAILVLVAVGVRAAGAHGAVIGYGIGISFGGVAALYALAGSRTAPR